MALVLILNAAVPARECDQTSGPSRTTGTQERANARVSPVPRRLGQLEKVQRTQVCFNITSRLPGDPFLVERPWRPRLRHSLPSSGTPIVQSVTSSGAPAEQRPRPGGGGFGCRWPKPHARVTRADSSGPGMALSFSYTQWDPEKCTFPSCRSTKAQLDFL